MIRLLLAALLVFIETSGVAGQIRQSNRGPGREIVRYGDLFYAGAVVFPGHGDRRRVDVLMRVEYDFLVFVRSDIFHPDSLFRAIAAFNVEAVNNQGKHVQFRLARDTVYAADYSRTNTRRLSLMRRISLFLEPGQYRLHAWVEDGESERKKDASLSIQVPSRERILFSVLPLEVDTTGMENGRFTAIGYGAAVHFARPSWIALTRREVKDASYKCILYQ
ncbi:MAG: hypothetical protein GXO82_03560, partial [Chlorobi bacterium]|nr:hypothetical protein [Chlorobiota bacterium]